MTSTGVRASGVENFELPSGYPFDPQSGPKSRVYLDGIWGIYLRPAPAARPGWPPILAAAPVGA